MRHLIDDVVADYGPAVAWVLAVALLILMGVTWAGAQPAQVTNPGAVIFTASADHAQVNVYELGYFAVGASAPTQVTGIAKAALTAEGADWRFVFPRLLFGTFAIRLRACIDITWCSPWVEADKQAIVVPFPPGVVRLQ